MRTTVFYLLLCLISFSCKKSQRTEIVFPSETQAGLNTFGCYINGEAFIPSTTLFGNVKPITAYYTAQPTIYYQAGFFSLQGIDARYQLDFAGNVGIQKLDVFSTGEYQLVHSANCGQPYHCDAGGYYQAKTGRTYFIENGKLTITRLDTINKILSGRFFFTARDTLGNVKTVTGGVFDTNYEN